MSVQLPDPKEVAKQEAEAINARRDYLLDVPVERMLGDASVQLDNREVLGCDLIYDFGAERVTSGSADCEGGFRVRVRRDSEQRATPPAPPQ